MSLTLNVSPEPVLGKAGQEREENKVYLDPRAQVHSSYTVFLQVGTLKSLRIHSNLTLNQSFHVHFERIFVEVGILNVFSNSLLA